MSLAVMCKYYMPLLDITAFIVDHKLRPSSTSEANTVQKTLRELGDYSNPVYHTQSLSDDQD
jgi:tRNA(Ile)-lysidine synthase TilS/MesJ